MNEEYLELVTRITLWSHQYYNLDRPTVSDATWDRDFNRLLEIEEANPEIISPVSPSKRIGGAVSTKFEKVKHENKMLSLYNVFNEADLYKFFAKIRNVHALNFCVETKLDGLAVNLVYEKGVLILGATRGDGTEGEDITENLKTISDIPLILQDDIRGPSWVEIRGEVMMSFKSFEEVNKLRVSRGDDPYVNPRNAAAGALRQLDSKETSLCKLMFMPYDIISNLGLWEQSTAMDFLVGWGFRNNTYRKTLALKDVFAYCQELLHLRNDVPYPIDGVVIKIDDMLASEDAGFAGRYPKGWVAYKFPAEEEMTTVENVVFQVGRFGAITPVAELKPVFVGGATISRSTLHNADEIKRLGLYKDDTVVIRRAGDVIPQIVSVVSHLRKEDSTPWLFPTTCPCCGNPLIKEVNKVVSGLVTKESSTWRCNKGFECSDQLKQCLRHYVSRKCMNITGIGIGLITKLVDGGFVKDPADLFNLPLDSIGGKLAVKLNVELNKAKRVPLDRFIYGLGIREVGRSASKNLASHFGDFDDFWNADLNELLDVKDIGVGVANLILEFFAKPSSDLLIARLLKAGIEIIEKEAVTGTALKGLIYVLTGGFKHATRTEITDKLVSMGAEVKGSVSKKTTAVFFGDNPGSTVSKAERLGIPVVDESKMWQILGIVEGDN